MHVGDVVSVCEFPNSLTGYNSEDLQGFSLTQVIKLGIMQSSQCSINNISRFFLKNY